MAINSFIQFLYSFSPQIVTNTTYTLSKKKKKKKKKTELTEWQSTYVVLASIIQKYISLVTEPKNLSVGGKSFFEFTLLVRTLMNMDDGTITTG